MSGKRSSVRLLIMFTAARVVSNRKSHMKFGIPGTVGAPGGPPGRWCGWVSTTAEASFSSANTLS